jgi:hypothetical protein
LKDKAITVVMITVDRAPRRNYLGETLANLARAGVFDSQYLNRFAVFDSRAGNYARDILSTAPHVVADVWSDNRVACENAGAALVAGAESGASWVLFMEDDIDVCSHFLESVAEWLDDVANQRFRLYALGANYEQLEAAVRAGGIGWEYPVGAFYGTQCFAVRAEDAATLGAYWLTNPIVRTVRNPNAYDLMVHDWAAANYPNLQYFCASAPSFVQHIGRESVCTGKPVTHEFPSWRGRDWRYRGRLLRSA